MALPGDALPDGEKFFHAQYCWSLEEAKMRTHWVGKGKGKPATKGDRPGSASDGMPASGGNEVEGNTFLMRDDSGAGHWLREATVIGLPELFASFGNIATAVDLYEWWGQARVIVHKRVRGGSNPARKEAAWRRRQQTGCWGWGDGAVASWPLAAMSSVAEP